MGIRGIVNDSIGHLEVSIPKAPMKRATLYRAQKVWISYVLVSIHLCMMTRAERANVSSKWGAGHRETLPQTLEDVCSTANM